MMQAHQDRLMRRVKAAYEFPVSGYREGWLDDWKERWDLIVEEVHETGKGSPA